jgi:hypothetical protein
MSFIFRRLFGSAPSINMEAAQKKAQALIDENAVSMLSSYSERFLFTQASASC